MKRKILAAAFAVSAVFASIGSPSGFTGDESLFSYSVSAASKTDAPSGLKATAGEGGITLKWNIVKGADGYRIYQYDSSTKKFKAVKTVTGTKTTVNGLSAGTYYFKVAAVTKESGRYIAGTLSQKVSVSVKAASSGNTSKPAPSSSENRSSSDAVELAKKMGDGTNLGNTMEAVANWLGSNPKAADFEKAWGQPTTTNAMIKGMKAAGFDSVRVPVAWSNIMSKDGKYTISDDYFRRVDEIVGYVLDNDMYCIINIHWDGGWWEDFGSSDEKVRDAAMTRYKIMWKQIAEHYKDYSDKLIFESANEELGDSTKGKDSLDESYKKVNTINQTFVDVVRKSGGNNKSRFLLIAGYNTDIQKTADSRYKMPKDTVKGRLLVSVHYYSPSTYCIADDPNNSWGYMDSWGTVSDMKKMDNELAKMKKFTDAGYGVIIGEYGVALGKNGTKYSVKKGTDKFFECMREYSAKYGYCAMLWDCSQWYDRRDCRMKYSDIAKIYD